MRLEASSRRASFGDAVYANQPRARLIRALVRVYFWDDAVATIWLKKNLVSRIRERRFVVNDYARFAGQGDRLQCLPASQVPGREAVAIKVKGFVGLRPGLNISFERLSQDRVNEIPIPVVVIRVLDEAGLFHLFGEPLVFDSDLGFQGIFIGVEQEQRWQESNTDEGLVRDRVYGIKEGRGGVGQNRTGPPKHIKFVRRAGHENQPLDHIVGSESVKKNGNAVGAIEFGDGCAKRHLLESGGPGSGRAKNGLMGAANEQATDKRGRAGERERTRHHRSAPVPGRSNTR